MTIQKDTAEEAGQTALAGLDNYDNVPWFHDVELREGSIMARIFGPGPLRVNTTHHQGVRRIGRGLAVTAWSADGLVEAMEDEGGAPILLVQFHPERMTGIDPAFCGIFRWLVESTRRESPRIGLVYTKNYTRKRKSGNDRIGEYRKAVEDAGGRVAEIDQGEDPAITESVMESIDALLIPGGKDIDPVLFAEEPHPRVEHYDPGLDRLQLSLLAMAEKRGIPILGICRGIQIMNVHRGGDLYQDVPSQLGREVVHRVKRWELQGYE